MNDILQYKGYFATVHFSGDDDVFYGKILGINDLVSFEGSTVKELKKSFQDAVDDYLEICKKLKKDPDKGYKGSFNVRIPAELHREAANYSVIRNMSLNDFVRYAIDFTLRKSTDPPKNIRTLVILLVILLPGLLPGYFMTFDMLF
jgi:predicted HicB family RNase H-like nuclease